MDYLRHKEVEEDLIKNLHSWRGSSVKSAIRRLISQASHYLSSAEMGGLL